MASMEDSNTRVDKVEAKVRRLELNSGGFVEGPHDVAKLKVDGLG